MTDIEPSKIQIHHIYGSMPEITIECDTLKEASELRQQIIQDHEIVERLKAEIESIDKVQHGDPRTNNYCVECEYKQKLKSILGRNKE